MPRVRCDFGISALLLYIADDRMESDFSNSPRRYRPRMRGRLGLREAGPSAPAPLPRRVPVVGEAMAAVRPREAPVALAVLGRPDVGVTEPPTLPALTGYSSKAPLLAIVLIGLFCARITELVPQLNPLRPTLVVSVVGLALVLVQSSWAVIRDVLRHPTFRLVALYGLWALVTSPFALWPGLALESAIGLFIPAMVVCFIILACRPSQENVDRLSFGFVIAVVIQVSWILLLGATRAGNRLTSDSSLDPNDLGSLVSLSFPLAVGHAIRSRGHRRFIAAAAATLFVVTLMRTGSRGGTLAFVTATLVFAAGFPGRRRVMALVMVALLAPTAWVLGPPEYRTRMATMLSLDEDYNNTSYTGRKQVRERAQQYYLQNPVTGVGMFCFGLAEGMRNKEVGRTGKWSAPHNAYWQALSELGTPGGVAFFGMIIASMVFGFRVWRWRNRDRTPNAFHRPEFLAGLSGFAVGAYFLSHAYFWALFGLVALIALAARAAAVPATVPAAGSVASARRRGGWQSRAFAAGRTASQP